MEQDREFSNNEIIVVEKHFKVVKSFNNQENANLKYFEISFYPSQKMLTVASINAENVNIFLC